MTCQYLHKLCPKGGCENYVCRAYFPDKQPMIQKDLLETCKGEEYATECLEYEAGTNHREEKISKRLEKQCKFATNNRCDKPWIWDCKAYHNPGPLTIFEVNEKGLPKRGADGNVVFIVGVDDFKDTCLLGGVEVYTKCPHYIDAMEYIKEYYTVKPSLKSEENK